MATPKQIALRVGVALAIGLLMAQFVRPGLARPPAMADLKAPRSVKQIFRASYYPCHSNELQLAWFDEIVPAYQLVGDLPIDPLGWSVITSGLNPPRTVRCCNVRKCGSH